MSRDKPTTVAIKALKVVAKLLPGADGKQYADRAKRAEERRNG